MQNRYAGDIGDFGKFGLLKAIEGQNLKVGVNWYLTEPIDEKEKMKNDGKHGIKEKFKSCDEELFGKLDNVFKLHEKRNVKSIENENPLNNAIYYSIPINIDNREKWHNGALKELKKCKVVFLDPDNGLEVESAKGSKKKLTKYVLINEIKSYINDGKSVVLYNHRPRRDMCEYFKELFSKIKKATGVDPFSISFHRGTVRDYIIIPFDDEHKEKLLKARNCMLDTDSNWRKMKLCQLDYGN